MSNGEIISTMRADPDAATLPRRALSLAVDAALMLIVFGGGAAAVAWWRESTDSSQVNRLITAMTWPMRLASIAIRNWRSPGRRVAGIRCVDARTGGPVTLRSAVVAELVGSGWTRIAGPLVMQVNATGGPAREAARRRIEEVRRTHAGDIARIHEETMRIYREDNVSCVPTLLAMLGTASVQPLSALLSPRRQTFLERLAGTVVIREPRR
jgi:uncharacterized RDD family membrane protein YckC